MQLTGPAIDVAAEAPLLFVLKTNGGSVRGEVSARLGRTVSTLLAATSRVTRGPNGQASGHLSET